MFNTINTVQDHIPSPPHQTIISTSLKPRPITNTRLAPQPNLNLATTSVFFPVDQNRNAGNTAAMADSFPHLATFSDISARRAAPHPNLPAHIVAQSSHEPRPETATWRTRNVSSSAGTRRCGFACAVHVRNLTCASVSSAPTRLGKVSSFTVGLWSGGGAFVLELEILFIYAPRTRHGWLQFVRH